MEVHHHAHTARKKWTHYFWEFIMLFLAVFCGFLAEYALEHKIEKDREEQFIRSLVNDIKADIAQLNLVIQKRDEKVQVIFLLNSPNFAIHGNSIYFNAIHTARLVDIRFTANDGTLLQLKNSGGLRLIRNRAVADSIVHYDVSVRNLETLGEQEVLIAHEYRTVARRIFNSLVYDKMLDENNISSRPEGNPSLLAFSKQDLADLNYTVYSIKLIVKGMRRDSKKLLQQATNLLAVINKEYHLE
jgi:hypothetical protein